MALAIDWQVVYRSAAKSSWHPGRKFAYAIPSDPPDIEWINLKNDAELPAAWQF
ncbi:hypothetical protein PTE30175_00009 [Pandoraea terrae]|uniref:Uncharacterized protein n=1 Tax=Pandoraea terrae TaxID=1537710 RepID=A0A5E4RAP2_9BURK|nr:hypothetical protein PTE30175_00009 [Pandoraea terrae]